MLFSFLNKPLVLQPLMWSKWFKNLAGPPPKPVDKNKKDAQVIQQYQNAEWKHEREQKDAVSRAELLVSNVAHCYLEDAPPWSSKPQSQPLLHCSLSASSLLDIDNADFDLESDPEQSAEDQLKGKLK